jgi:diaminopimelate epimerase
MIIPFEKYQATGNDFVLIDQRDQKFLTRKDRPMIEKLCDRRFGIGADGLILLENHPTVDFEMIYFNSDGNESTMCGNGGRCIVKFAQKLGIIKDKCQFLATDGVHEALINSEDWVELKMIDVNSIKSANGSFILETGSPHYVTFENKIVDLDVKSEGAKIRYSPPFIEKGININFVEEKENSILVRTYERGVEDETLSCGTGVTAAALTAARHLRTFQNSDQINITTPGGQLKVKFTKSDKTFHDIWLCGPATYVYSGTISI